MTQPEVAASDDPVRRRAIESDESIVLQAPAGSGKTSVLTQRILRLLAQVDEPEEILAITFTRKAAAEMRDRVLRALQGRIDAGASHAARLAELAAAARERSRRRGWDLEDDPGRLRIQTIDSLNRWLAAQLPVVARVAGELDVAARPRTLYAVAARRTLQEAERDPELQRDVELLFGRLDNDFGRFERLLTDMLGVRSHWLPRLEQHGDALCERVQQALRGIVVDRQRAAAAYFGPALLARAARLGAGAAQNLLEQDPRGTGAWRAWLDDMPAAAVGTAAGTTNAGQWSIAHWRALRELALTTRDEWRRTLDKRSGFPTTDRALKSAALEWLAEASGLRGGAELLAEIAALPDAVLDAEDAQAIDALARVLRAAAVQLQLVFGATGQVDYPDIAGAARRALTEEGAPSDLGLRLGASIRHILVDEFQDTSIEQYRLLEALTATWERGDGRTLFVVGDPMQSIYLFREAEVGLFLRIAQHGLGSVALEPLRLTRNFRAAPRIVRWLNETFRGAFPALDDVRAGAVAYRDSHAGRADEEAGTVHVHRVPSGDAAAEAAAIVDIVRRARRHAPGCSIAVLVAARTHAAPIARALGDAAIPVEGVDLVPLGTLPVIRDLESLARALDHLGDTAAWLALLRAPWCGLTLAELTVLRERPERTVWDAMGDPQCIAALDGAARARLERVREVLAAAFVDRGELDFATWIERTWLRLGGAATCMSDADLDHARTFFASLAAWCEAPHWTGPLELAQRLGELNATAAGTPGAVQVMTVHRAKGLEFDVVILPGLGRRLRGDTEPLLRCLELPREEGEPDLLMAPVPAIGREEDEPLNAYLKGLQRRRALNERVRLLYVAATRAREALHLFAAPADAQGAGGTPKPQPGTLLEILWPAIGPQVLAHELPGKHATAAGAIVPTPLLRRLPPDWRPPPLPAAVRVSTLTPAGLDDVGVPRLRGAEGRESIVAAAVGEVLRDQVRRFGRLPELPAAGSGGAAVAALRERLLRRGLHDHELAAAAARAVDTLASCLAHERFRWIFDPRHQQAEGPLRLSGLHEGCLISVTIDRCFVDSAGERWIVDFPAAGPVDASDEAYIAAEVERYRERLPERRALVQALYGQPVRAGLFFPLAARWVELDPRFSVAGTY